MQYIEEDREFGKPDGIGMPMVFLMVLFGHMAVVGGILGYHRIKDQWAKGQTAGGPPIGFRVGGIARADDPAGRLRPVDREARSVDAMRLAKGTPLPLEDGRSSEESPLDEGRDGPVVAAVDAVDAPEALGAAEYVVRKGDALTRIARQHGISVAELRLANGIDSDQIRMGQRLMVPKPAATKPAAAPCALAAPSAGPAYVVAKGDTLSGIARRFGVPMPALMQANGIQDANHLRVGRRLVIPAGEAGSGDARSDGRAASPSVAMSG